MRKPPFCLFLLILMCTSLLYGQTPYIVHYTVQNGLPSNTVYYIYQDSKKFIWFATDNGASRYDGTLFVNYQTRHGLDNKEVMRIKEDSFGRIWFFNINGTLNYFYHNKLFNTTNTPFLDSLTSPKFFRSFLQDDDKKIYFYNNRTAEITVLDTANHVRKIRLEMSIKLWWRAKPFNVLLPRFISKDNSGGFLVWSDIGVFKIRSFNEKPLITLVTDSLRVCEVYPGRNNTHYMDRLISMDTTGNFENGDHSALLRVTDEIPGTTLYLPFRSVLSFSSVLEDHDGFLWVSTFNKGVYCLKNNRIVQHFDIREAQSIIEDNENNIWISSMKDGVFKISPFFKFQPQYINDFFSKEEITALSPNYPHGIWCTNGVSTFLLNNHKIYTLNFRNEDNPFNALRFLNGNCLIAGKRSMQFCFFDQLTADPVTKKVTFSNTGKSPWFLKNVIANNKTDEITSFNQSTIITFSRDNLFRNSKRIDIGNRIYNAFYDGNGDLVINAGKNYIFRDDSLLPCPKLAGFGGKVIADHLVLNDSTELIHLDGDSIFLLSRGRTVNLTSVLGYPQDIQAKMIVYEAPSLYIATSGNIYKIDNPLNILVNKPVQMELIDLQFRNIQDMLVKEDTLYIGSDDGLLILPEAMTRNNIRHPVEPYCVSILINDQECDPQEKLINLAGNSRIAFTFSCINYSSSPVLFSYKMEGVDSNWTNVSSRNVIYQNLTRGSYRFLLRACKPTEDWSVPVEYRIVIKATFWQSPLPYMIIFVVLVAMLVIFIIRRKNLQMKKQELDQRLVTLELKALQSMMNPHFIFNALSSIQSFLLLNRTGEAGLYLSQFARLIRQNMNSINAAMINLEEEVDRLRNYLDLEKLRMENRFNYRIDVDEDVEADEIMIPSMIIQPFVENSIWHGISALDTGGLITIRFSRQDEKSILVIVEDNGIGVKKAQLYKSRDNKHLNVGMQMVRKRLDILGQKYKIKTIIDLSELQPDNENPGTVVRIIIPFLDADSLS